MFHVLTNLIFYLFIMQESFIKTLKDSIIIKTILFLRVTSVSNNDLAFFS